MNATLKFGTINDAKPGFAKVFFDEDDLITDWWPIITKTSLKDMQGYVLNTGEHVACITDDYCEIGIVLGAMHNDKDKNTTGAVASTFCQVFEDGTILKYDKKSHELTVDSKGKVVIQAANSIVITGDISVTGNITVTKNIKATGDIVAGTVSLKQHIHPGVTSGGASTAAPLP